MANATAIAIAKSTMHNKEVDEACLTAIKEILKRDPSLNSVYVSELGQSGPSKYDRGDVRQTAIAFVGELQHSMIEIEVEKRKVTEARTRPIYLRLSPLGVATAKAAAGFRGVDAVDIHLLSDRTHLHRLEPHPGSPDEIRLHDIAILLSNGITSMLGRKSR